MVMQALAEVVVALTGLFLLGLGAASLLVPARAKRFLLGFASSPLKHGFEMAVRTVIGGALVVLGPQTPWPAVFAGFGWILILTSAALLLVPWRWHRAFAQRSVPQALRFLPWIGLASGMAGAGLLVVLARL
jgi:hypothetical protein